jgi:multidrug efflux pump subunit AcrA (membrane-fusion protein)
MDVPVSPRRPRSRRPLILGAIALAIVAIVTAGLLFARNGQAKSTKKAKKEDGPTAAPVELTIVGKGDISTFLETTAVLEAANSAVLVARRQGQVTALLAEEGHNVSAGQPLARLDDAEARIALGRAHATY